MRKETNDYGLGDVIKRATSAVGIKPCTGCQKRAEALNRLSRRGILRSGVLVFLNLKNSALKWAWTQAGAPVPIDVEDAIGLLRVLNPIQLTLRTVDGSYGSQDRMMYDSEHGLAAHFRHMAAAGMPPITWENQVNFDTAEILPSWTIDFFVAGDGESYKLVLAGADDVLITEETGAIYRAPRGVLIHASQLKRAGDYPGSKPIDRYAVSTTRRLRDFFRPVGYKLQMNNPNCASHNSCFAAYGCIGCAFYCCAPEGTAQCFNGFPAANNVCYWNAGCLNCGFMWLNGCFGKAGTICYGASSTCAHAYYTPCPGSVCSGPACQPTC